MEIIKYKISRYGKSPLVGVKIKEGQQWASIKYNEVDYIIDGIRFINTKYICRQTKVEANDMVAKVIPLKYNDVLKDRELVGRLNLDSYHGFFCDLIPMGFLVEIGLDKEDCIYVGTITKVNEKSVTFDTIGTFAEDTGMMNIPFDRIRYISIETDYLNSLDLYLRHQKRK